MTRTWKKPTGLLPVPRHLVQPWLRVTNLDTCQLLPTFPRILWQWRHHGRRTHHASGRPTPEKPSGQLSMTPRDRHNSSQETSEGSISTTSAAITSAPVLVARL